MSKTRKKPSSPPAGHGRSQKSTRGNRYGCGGKIKKSK